MSLRKGEKNNNGNNGEDEQKLLEFNSIMCKRLQFFVVKLTREKKEQNLLIIEQNNCRDYQTRKKNAPRKRLPL